MWPQNQSYGSFFSNWELYISWINKRSIDLWFVRIGQYLAEIHLNIWILRVQKKKSKHLKKIAFKVVQIKAFINAYY